MHKKKIKLKNNVLTYDEGESFKIRYGCQAFAIDDKDQKIRTILSLFNGSSNLSEVIQKLSGSISKDFILEVYDNFNEALLLEFSEQETSLSEYEQIRWSRNFDFFNTFLKDTQNKYAYQEKIKKAHVLLLGCGGLGSHILYELAAVGFINLTIVDFDKIELSNLNRQILYKESDIGSEKVFTAEKRIKEFSPHMNIKAFSQKLSSSKDIASLIEGHDLVICVADKPRTQIVPWLNEACIKKNVPFINGGLNHSVAVIYTVLPRKTGCVDCWKTSVDKYEADAKAILDYDIEQNIDFPSPAPAFSPLVSVLTGLFVCEAVKIVTHISEPSFTNKKMIFDFASAIIKEDEKWEKDNDCPSCAA